jgi:hypothetical protein
VKQQNNLRPRHHLPKGYNDKAANWRANEAERLARELREVTEKYAAEARREEKRECTPAAKSSVDACSRRD